MSYVDNDEWINVIMVDDKQIDVESLILDYIDALKDCKTEEEYRDLLRMFFDDAYYIAAREILLASIQQQIQSLKKLEEEFWEE